MPVEAPTLMVGPVAAAIRSPKQQAKTRNRSQASKNEDAELALAHVKMANAELSRSRRRLSADEGGEPRTIQHRRKRKGWRMSAQVKS